MMQIAHVSDLHLLEKRHAERWGHERRRLAYLTFGRKNDFAERRRRVASAMETARRSDSDHVLITGDLTEDGLDPQFEVLAEVLAESGLSPSKVTLVPGNHDAYVDGNAFRRALQGPLRPYAETSEPGVPLVFRDAVVVPVSTAFKQSYAWSAGAIEPKDLLAVDCAAQQSRCAGLALILAMHHPPHPRMWGWHWIDGLRQHAAVGAILRQHGHAHVVHGHTHAATDRAVRPGAIPRIFSAAAAIDSETPVRVYHARQGRLSPATSLEFGAVPIRTRSEPIAT